MHDDEIHFSRHAVDSTDEAMDVTSRTTCGFWRGARRV